MSSDIEKLIKNLSEKVKELEERVSLLEDPIDEKPETDILGRRLIK